MSSVVTGDVIGSGVAGARVEVQAGTRGFWRRVARKPLGFASACYLVGVTFACVLAPAIAPYGPQQEDLLHTSESPSWVHLLGTDELGRDVLSRVLYGGRITLLGVVECVAVLLALSVPFGLASGYIGGWLDRVVNAVVDLMLSIPAIIVVLAVLAVFGSDMTVAMLTFGILGSAGVVRVVRSAVLSVREELFVAAARVSGVGEPRIVSRHVLPRIAGPVIVQASLWAAIALGVQTGLAFLSLGVAPPAPSWGGMVGEASQLIGQDTWLLVPSGGVIAITILAFGLIGDAVRDATVERWQGVAVPASRRGPIKRTGVSSPRELGAQSGLSAEEGAELTVVELAVAFSRAGQQVRVVDGVSFALAKGEILGIVGESGSGKSVTALAAMGLLPTGGSVVGGRVFLGDRDLTNLREREWEDVRGRGMAMVFQEPMRALDPSFTVGSQVAEVVRRHEKIGRRGVRDRALEVLAEVQLPDPAAVARHYPHELSGGMAQRVCIALALAAKPRVLIADEPTTALDVTVQAEILGLLRMLRDQTGTSVVLVTHDWGVVADTCDRAIVMYAGQVVEQASVDALFRDPHHPYSVGLQLSNPEHADPSRELPVIPGTVPPPELWPASCRFRDRCSFAKKECGRGPVALELTAGEREVRCLWWQEVADRAGTAEGEPAALR